MKWCNSHFSLVHSSFSLRCWKNGGSFNSRLDSSELWRRARRNLCMRTARVKSERWSWASLVLRRPQLGWLKMSWGEKNTWNAVSLDVISIMMSIMVYFVGTVFALLGCMLMHLLGMRGSGFQGMIHYHPSWQTYTNEWMFAIYVPSFFGMSPTIVQWLPCVLIIWCSEVWVSGGAQGKSRIRWPMGAFSPWRQELT